MFTWEKLPSLISLMGSVDVKHHVYLGEIAVPNKPYEMVSVDVKHHDCLLGGERGDGKEEERRRCLDLAWNRDKSPIALLVSTVC